MIEIGSGDITGCGMHFKFMEEARDGEMAQL